MRRHVCDTNKRNAGLLRRQRTKPEQLLRSHLRCCRQFGFPVRFQHCIGEYIVDFACVKAKIVVEVDGRSHDGREEFDERRDAVLTAAGWRVLRYSNDAIIENVEGVANDIIRQIQVILGNDNPLLSSPRLGGGIRKVK